jgi:hypothetical protein
MQSDILYPESLHCVCDLITVVAFKITIWLGVQKAAAVLKLLDDMKENPQERTQFVQNENCSNNSTGLYYIHELFLRRCAGWYAHIHRH